MAAELSNAEIESKSKGIVDEVILNLRKIVTNNDLEMDDKIKEYVKTFIRSHEFMEGGFPTDVYMYFLLNLADKLNALTPDMRHKIKKFIIGLEEGAITGIILICFYEMIQVSGEKLYERVKHNVIMKLKNNKVYYGNGVYNKYKMILDKIYPDSIPSGFQHSISSKLIIPIFELSNTQIKEFIDKLNNPVTVSSLESSRNQNNVCPYGIKCTRLRPYTGPPNAHVHVSYGKYSKGKYSKGKHRGTPYVKGGTRKKRCIRKTRKHRK